MKIVPIKDIKIYQEEMAKSVQDKLFFLDHCWVEGYFMDYGCADGSVAAAFRERAPNAFILGYDKNDNMIFDANQRNMERSIFLSNYQKFSTYAAGYVGAFLLSSVLHEVGDNEEELLKIFKLIGKKKPSYVIIRDMYTTGGELEVPIEYSLSVSSGELKQYNQDSAFHSSTWGGMLQYYLKYRYKVNRKRELQEDYFGANWNTASLLLKVLRYELYYEEFYTLPFIKDQVRKDFDIELPNTHRKQIWKWKS